MVRGLVFARNKVSWTQAWKERSIIASFFMFGLCEGQYDKILAKNNIEKKKF